MLYSCIYQTAVNSLNTLVGWLSLFQLNTSTGPRARVIGDAKAECVHLALNYAVHNYAVHNYTAHNYAAHNYVDPTNSWTELECYQHLTLEL